MEEEVNVRSLEVCSDASVYTTTRGEPNWSALGKRLGKALAGVTKAIKALDGAALAAYERDGKATVEGHELGLGDITIVREFRKPEGAAPCDAAGDGDVLVVLEVSVDDELVEAGVAREVVNRIQKARKAAGLVAAEVIEVFWSSADEAPGRIFKARARSAPSAISPLSLPASPAASLAPSLVFARLLCRRVLLTLAATGLRFASGARGVHAVGAGRRPPPRVGARGGAGDHPAGGGGGAEHGGEGDADALQAAIGKPPVIANVRRRVAVLRGGGPGEVNGASI